LVAIRHSYRFSIPRDFLEGANFVVAGSVPGTSMRNPGDKVRRAFTHSDCGSQLALSLARFTKAGLIVGFAMFNWQVTHRLARRVDPIHLKMCWLTMQ
jgi:hypothetical protein